MLRYIFVFISVFVCFECSNCPKDKFVVTVPDDSDITRPCCFDDLPCIIKEFRSRGWCDKAPEYPYNGNTLPISRLDYGIPFFDVYVVQTGIEFKNLAKGKIVELYINNKTGNSVFSIQFDDLEITAQDVQLRLARPLKEDIYVNTPSCELYDHVVVSSIIPPGPGREIIPNIKSRAFDLKLAKYDFGATVDTIENETVKKAIQKYLGNKEVVVNDLFKPDLLHRAHIMSCSFVENIICGNRPKPHC